MQDQPLSAEGKIAELKQDLHALTRDVNFKGEHGRNPRGRLTVRRNRTTAPSRSDWLGPPDACRVPDVLFRLSPPIDSALTLEIKGSTIL